VERGAHFCVKAEKKKGFRGARWLEYKKEPIKR
jgi:hypothetical protein